MVSDCWVVVARRASYSQPGINLWNFPSFGHVAFVAGYFSGWVIVAFCCLEVIVWSDIFQLFGETNISGKKCFRQFPPTTLVSSSIPEICRSPEGMNTFDVVLVVCVSPLGCQSVRMRKFERFAGPTLAQSELLSFLHFIPLMNFRAWRSFCQESLRQCVFRTLCLLINLFDKSLCVWR